MEKHLGQVVAVGHEGIQEGVGMIQTSINNIRELLATIRNGNCPTACGDSKSIPTSMSLADTLEQTPGVLAEQREWLLKIIELTKQIDEAIAELEALQQPKSCEECKWNDIPFPSNQFHCDECKYAYSYYNDNFEPKEQ